MPVVLETIDTSPFSAFTGALPATCACFGFAIRNSAALEGAIDVSPEFAFALVDRFFGGAAQIAVLDRSLTLVERLAVRMVAERVVHHVMEVWHDHVPLTLAISAFESEPEMVQWMRRDDEVLVASFSVQSDHGRGSFRICMPLGAIERFFETSDRRGTRAARPATGGPPASNPFAEATVRRMPVDVSVRMPAFDVPMRQLLALPPGTVLATGLPTDAQLEVYVCDTHRFFATPGRVGSRMAVRVLDSLQATTLDGHGLEPPSASTSV
jgi:flagellar motor switch protein FliM